MERIRVCLACGELVPFEERTCPSCGHDEPIEGLAPCPGCGQAVPEELIFCPGCGLDRGPEVDLREAPPTPRWQGAGSRSLVDHVSLGLTLLGPLVLAVAVALVASAGD